MKKLSTLLILGVIVVLLSGAYSGYAFWQKGAAEASLKVVSKEVTSLQNEVLQFENNKIEQAVNAKKTVEALSEEGILWSDVIKDVRKTIPENKDRKPLVEVLSYAGSGNNAITLNVQTASESDNPYLDVAKVIQTFDESENFTENFVPSISSGRNTEGVEVLTFSLSTIYVAEPEVKPATSTQKAPVSR